MESFRNAKWDLEVVGSPANSESLLKLPLTHPMGLPEKCTYCITDQLTLSAVPHSDWHCTLRKLQTFTSADKTRFSPHTSSSTSLSQRTHQSFMLWSSAADICEPWWVKPLSPRWARGQKTPKNNSSTCCKQTKHEPWNKQPFWFADNKYLTHGERDRPHQKNPCGL